jgi:hypothetical protein
MNRRNIHALFQTFLPEDAHEYCVQTERNFVRGRRQRIIKGPCS